MALPLSISIPNVFDTPAPPMVPQTSLLGRPALQESFAHDHGFSPFPHCLSRPVKHSWCFLSHGVQWHHCHLHFRATAGLCPNTTLSPAPCVRMLGSSGCAAAAALPMQLYLPSLCLPVATAHGAVSSHAPFQDHLPPAGPRLFSPLQAP